MDQARRTRPGRRGCVAIGTPGAFAEVKGTVLCGTNGDGNGGISVLVDTPLVEFDPQGEARFSGEVGLTPAALATAAIQDV